MNLAESGSGRHRAPPASLSCHLPDGFYVLPGCGCCSFTPSLVYSEHPTGIVLPNTRPIIKPAWLRVGETCAESSSAFHLDLLSTSATVLRSRGDNFQGTTRPPRLFPSGKLSVTGAWIIFSSLSPIFYRCKLGDWASVADL